MGGQLEPLHRVDGPRRLGVERLRQAPGPLGEAIAEALAPGRHLHQPADELRVREIERFDEHLLSRLEPATMVKQRGSKLIETRSAGQLNFHVASLYPMLYRMERRAWIEGKWVEKAGQRRRRYYTLTREGRKVLGEQRASWQELLSALQRVTGISTPE